MENMGVRFIPTDHYKGKWSGNKPALCFRGEKRARCVVIREGQIETVDLPIDVIEKSTVVEYPQGSGVPYPPKRFVAYISGIAKPVTPEARVLLQTVNGKKVALPMNKPKKATATGGPGKAPLKTAGAELIIQIAKEVKLPTPKLRRFLRSQGLKAPYTDEKPIRQALKKLKKVKK